VTNTDWVLLSILLLSMLVGAWRGLVHELMSLAGWVVGFVMAQWFAAEAAVWLPLQGASPQIQYAAGFIVVFVAAMLATALVARLLGKLVASAGLKPADRSLGALFGLTRGLLLLLAATVVLQMTGLARQDWWQQATAVPWLDTLLQGLRPMLPETFVRYWPA